MALATVTTSTKGTIIMATEKTANYTATQEAIIRSFIGTGPDGKLTSVDADTIAAMDGMKDADGNARKGRSIIAKINRMGLPYAKKETKRKDGSAVASKAKLVAEIASAIDVNFDSLDKAGREDLVKLRDAVARLTAKTEEAKAA